MEGRQCMTVYKAPVTSVIAPSPLCPQNNKKCIYVDLTSLTMFVFAKKITIKGSLQSSCQQASCCQHSQEGASASDKHFWLVSPSCFSTKCQPQHTSNAVTSMHSISCQYEAISDTRITADNYLFYYWKQTVSVLK